MEKFLLELDIWSLYHLRGRKSLWDAHQKAFQTITIFVLSNWFKTPFLLLSFTKNVVTLFLQHLPCGIGLPIFRDANVLSDNLFCWNLCQICTVGSKGFECTEKSNKLLIKGGTVVNADHQQQADVYVEDGIITLVAPNLKVPKNSPLKILTVNIC